MPKAISFFFVVLIINPAFADGPMRNLLALKVRFHHAPQASVRVPSGKPLLFYSAAEPPVLPGVHTVIANRNQPNQMVGLLFAKCLPSSKSVRGELACWYRLSPKQSPQVAIELPNGSAAVHYRVFKSNLQVKEGDCAAGVCQVRLSTALWGEGKKLEMVVSAAEAE